MAFCPREDQLATRCRVDRCWSLDVHFFSGSQDSLDGNAATKRSRSGAGRSSSCERSASCRGGARTLAHGPVVWFAGWVFPSILSFPSSATAARADERVSIHEAAQPRVVDESQHCHERKQAGPSVTHQGQRQAGDWQLVGHHPDIDHDMEKQQGCDAHGD